MLCADTIAVQLAALSSIHETLSQNALPLPMLIAADHDLLAAASAEGFAVDDPNNHSSQSHEE